MPGPVHELGVAGVQTEAMPRQFFLDFLNRVANHEFKLAVAGFFLSQPGELFKISTLSAGVKKLQAGRPGWNQDPKTTFTYCGTDLEPTGLLIPGSLPSESARWPDRHVPAYQVDESLYEPGLAIFGETAEWSLKHEGETTQRLLGETQTKTDARGPELRWRIYRHIDANPDIALCNRDIHSAIANDGADYTFTNVSDLIRELDKQDILVVRSTHEDGFDPVVEIKDPELRHNYLTLQTVKPETRVLYQTMQRLHDRGITVINTKGLLAACLETDETIDPHALGNLLSQARSKSPKVGNIPGLVLLDNDGIEPGKQSRAEIHPSVEVPVVDLTNRLNDLFNGVGLAESVEKALKILKDSDSIRELTAKAKRFSSTFNFSPGEGGHEKAISQVEAAVNALGLGTVPDIQRSLDVKGIKLSDSTVRVCLADLVERGVFEAIKLPTKPHSKRMVLNYQRIETAPS